jgi:hypothetical protein
MLPIPLFTPIRLDVSVARIEIGDRRAEVRRALGRPARIQYGPQRIGFIAQTWTYQGRRLKIEFLYGGGRLSVYAITSRSPLDRTRRGVGVGSSEAAVRAFVPDVHCYRDKYIGRHCRRPREGGVGGTLFLISGGRVRSVEVFAPVF